MSVLVAQQVSSLSVNELFELIQKAVRGEMMRFFELDQELIAESPPIRKIDTVMEKMGATGKYNKEFLDSLRKRMEQSKTFG
ncbi:hypothetical protein AUJ95_03645 [Candidatus Desantisbacteria bacterium CG2_30_40_21]|uniref:Uncharacterized protein n=5 Tax=unclassified Candidatus Desantisiibacteriota TaxID=3106372 RepID=A0A2M7JAN2_9BACT|nr:MAG: hypothetical protein AUJ95_03645 [Candidatus Desantisbacteria bacterium CG2_30_40_21]PIP39753.1 MAG: hypothetical protein COX18_09030 [Candidatus Desantisbacteria bacterium CG23_combo_of_CG06-09_8_20_14_all_40_23]PIX16459.1 MAG: hypothetical protein COZ71_07590 [Candidatus Desantisbacteria bacterium CG_4_8_14_3_um_filter_40_12]PIY18949.1 MAG: hypothetical protein COZ13_07925 [Candidatus Desantisbacteria bacterium CG_4_10_14_3_um_filter_40_18]PJB28909.1 MAG: hypothetical protein CO110_08